MHHNQWISRLPFAKHLFTLARFEDGKRTREGHTLKFFLVLISQRGNWWSTVWFLFRNLSDIVVPLEYGITASEKLAIAEGICSPLLRKIRADLNQVVNYTEDVENINRLHPRCEFRILINISFLPFSLRYRFLIDWNLFLVLPGLQMVISCAVGCTLQGNSSGFSRTTLILKNNWVLSCSESHIHSLVNILKFGGLFTVNQ